MPQVEGKNPLNITFRYPLVYMNGEAMDLHQSCEQLSWRIDAVSSSVFGVLLKEPEGLRRV